MRMATHAHVPSAQDALQGLQWLGMGALRAWVDHKGLCFPLDETVCVERKRAK